MLFKRAKKETEKANSLARVSSDGDGSDRTAPVGDDPLDRLTPSQREALLAQIETSNVKPVTYFGLFRYASTQDLLLESIAVLTCIAAGAALVSMNIC
jgi:ATP-binding cassette subfamily B (MDR/TAP) protein 1